MSKNSLQSQSFTNVFHVAKLNISENIFVSREKLNHIIKKEIPQAILTPPKIVVDLNDQEKEVTFTDIEYKKENGGYYLFGNLTLSGPETMTVVTEENQTKEEIINEPIAETASFFYEVYSELLFFSTTKKITKKRFIEYFNKILSHSSNIGNLEIIMLSSSVDVIKRMDEFEKITNIKFNFVHPNPPSPKTRNEFKEKVEEVNATNARIEFTNKNEGLAIEKEEGKAKTIQDGLDLIEEGYGDLTITGRRKGKDETFYSKEKNIKIKPKKWTFKTLFAKIKEIVQGKK